MRVHIKVHPYLRQCLSASQTLVRGETRDLPEGITAEQVTGTLDLPRGFPVIVMINGVSCNDPASTPLKEEDTVFVSPVMAGG